MKLSHLLLGIALLCQTAVTAQNLTLKRKDLGSGISMLIPEELRELPSEQISQRYIMSKKPIAAYYTPARPVDFTLTARPSTWLEEDFDMMKQFQKANLLSLFTQVDMQKETVKKINGQRWAIFEMMTEVSEKNKPTIKKYSYVMYTIHKKKVLIAHFSAPASDHKIWAETAGKMMNSIKL